LQIRKTESTSSENIRRNANAGESSNTSVTKRRIGCVSPMVGFGVTVGDRGRYGMEIKKLRKSVEEIDRILAEIAILRDQGVLLPRRWNKTLEEIRQMLRSTMYEIFEQGLKEKG